MVLRLDSRFAVVWRTPNSLQFGVNSPPVVLDDVSTAVEHMVAAISAGVTPSGLAMIGRSAGASEQEVDEFLIAVGPVLESIELPDTKRIVIVGTGRTADRLARLLASAGFDLRVALTLDAAESEDCDLGIAVSSYVVEPALHGLWLRRDTPHLPIILGDTAVEVGPLIEPGKGPCLYCLHRYATDADPAWPAIASQLWGKHSGADNELIASEAAATATRLIVGFLAGNTGHSVGTRVSIDVGTGALTESTFVPHPDCGCLEAGAANGSVRQESGSASADRRRAPATGTTTTRAAAAPE